METHLASQDIAVCPKEFKATQIQLSNIYSVVLLQGSCCSFKFKRFWSSFWMQNWLKDESRKEMPNLVESGQMLHNGSFSNEYSVIFGRPHSSTQQVKEKELSCRK